MRLSDLFSGMTVLTVTGDDNVEITSLTKDSREVRPGCLFFVTESSERFLSDIAGKGVSAVVSDRYVTEAFLPVLAPELRAWKDVAVRFQRVLGDLHDHDVAIEIVNQAPLDPLILEATDRALTAKRQKFAQTYLELMGDAYRCA